MKELYKNTSGLPVMYLKPSANDRLLKISIAKFKKIDVNIQMTIVFLKGFLLKTFIFTSYNLYTKYSNLLNKVNIPRVILALF